ncbi:hypothetical protein [Leptospira jelokensis]|nr:hypothetical protein [Leptospira jelokensis]
MYIPKLQKKAKAQTVTNAFAKKIWPIDTKRVMMSNVINLTLQSHDPFVK